MDVLEECEQQSANKIHAPETEPLDLPPSTSEALVHVIEYLEQLEAVEQRQRVIAGLVGLYDILPVR